MLWEVAVEVGWNVEWREGAMGRTSSLLRPILSPFSSQLLSPSGPIPTLPHSCHLFFHWQSWIVAIALPTTTRIPCAGAPSSHGGRAARYAFPRASTKGKMWGKCDDDNRKEAVDVQSMPAYLQTPAAA
jgi:hypothetical protein